RVTAWDDATNSSGYTAAFSFVIDTAAPPKPTLTSPGNNSETNDATPTFTWTDTGADSYTLQYATNAGFSVGLETVNRNTPGDSTSYTPGSNLAQGTWYWRVTAWDDATNSSGYTAAFTVLVDTTPPVLSNNRPAFKPSDEEILFQITIEDAGSGVFDDAVAATSVSARYDTDGEVVTNYIGQLDMDLTSGDSASGTYTADFPIAAGTFSQGDIVTWAVMARDTAGNVVNGNWANTYTVIITSATPEIVSSYVESTKMYSYYDTYDLRAVVTDVDADGDTANFEFVEVSIPIDGGDSVAMRWTQSSNTFDTVSTGNYFEVDNGSVVIDNDTLTVTFSVHFTWLFPSPGVTGKDLVITVKDVSGASTGPAVPTTRYYGDGGDSISIEPDVRVMNFVVNDDTRNPSDTVSFTGTVKYEGTDTPVADALIGKVEIVRAGNTVAQIPDADAAFTAEVTLPDTVGLFEYHPKVELVGSGGSVETTADLSLNTDAVTVDRIKITNITISNHVYYDGTRYWDNNDTDGTDTMTITLTGVWEYGGGNVDTATVKVGYGSDSDAYGVATFSGGTASIDVEENPGLGQIITRDGISCD
ncbi:MAG: Ig-like domain-containing protein, partial [bacterium]|nr:Ig-like domain-containing protein [bacterium]